jgi:hypothetical protein
VLRTSLTKTDEAELQKILDQRGVKPEIV